MWDVMRDGRADVVRQTWQKNVGEKMTEVEFVQSHVTDVVAAFFAPFCSWVATD